MLAKNDRLDARLIAEHVAIMPTRVVQRDAAVERLAEIVTMRRQLCDEHVAVENQAAHVEDAMLRRLVLPPPPLRPVPARASGALAARAHGLADISLLLVTERVVERL